jgi:hypothetical protein
VHYLRWAAGEGSGDTSDVDGESMARAVKLVDYFKGHARKVYACMDADARAPAGKRLLAWTAGTGRACFTRRDACRALRPEIEKVEQITPVLELLERHGYIRPLPSPEGYGAGRKPSPAFEVHPSTLGQNGHNGQNHPPDEG